MKKPKKVVAEKREMDADVSKEERLLLSKADRPETDETKDLEKLALDKTGNNSRTNEKGNPLDMGADLDIPGAELDDQDEIIGEEDEENNSYSQRD